VRRSAIAATVSHRYRKKRTGVDDQILPMSRKRKRDATERPHSQRERFHCHQTARLRPALGCPKGLATNNLVPIDTRSSFDETGLRPSDQSLDSRELTNVWSGSRVSLTVRSWRGQFTPETCRKSRRVSLRRMGQAAKGRPSPSVSTIFDQCSAKSLSNRAKSISASRVCKPHFNPAFNRL
jgi:hypothetical protein